MSSRKSTAWKPWSSRPTAPASATTSSDRVYKTTREKYEAAIKDIRECHERGQPVLVGTTSIENSEIIDQLLNKEGLPHQVLNAKQHAREADIVAQAGREGMITIATNMAGRGTDIVLGGNIEKDVAAIEANAVPVRIRARRQGRSAARAVARQTTKRSRPWAACASLPPSAMSLAASTTSCVAVPAARATPAPHVST